MLSVLLFSYTSTLVFAGIFLTMASSSAVGCFLFLRKKSLLADTVAHGIFPGICLAFMVSFTKNYFLLTLGATLMGWLSLLAVEHIHQNSKLKEDAAMGIVLSVFFGVGVVLLTYLQNSGAAQISGLNHFLFGKAASINRSDLLVIVILSFFILLSTFVFKRSFTWLSFDEAYLRSLGFPLKRVKQMLTLVTLLSIVMGVQIVGIVLMAAAIITPAATARYWTRSINGLMSLALFIGIFAGFSGSYVSYSFPKTPTGPWIVVFLSFLAFFSFFFSPYRGVIRYWLKKRKSIIKTLDENVLKVIYKITEKDAGDTTEVDQILQHRKMNIKSLKSTLKRLHRQGFIHFDNEIVLLKQGFEKGKRITRLHRLWELYLTQYLKIAPDHVHEDAETIEHIITPELEAKMLKDLNYPLFDPHQQKIPH